MDSESRSERSDRRILYVTKTALTGEGGGGEKRAREVTTRLAAHGHNVTVICGKTDPGLPKWDYYDGITVRHVWCGPEALLTSPRLGFYLPRYLFAFASLPILLYHLFFDDFDVVIENMTPYPTLTVVFAKLFSTPIVAVQHEFHGHDAVDMYDPLTGRIQLLVQNILRIFTYDRVIVPTQHVKKELSAYGIDSDRITVIPNGINVDRYQLDGVERSPNRLITVSRLGARKGVDDVLRSFAVIQDRHPDVTLDVVGSGPERDSLEALARTLDVDDAVTFHGFVSHDRKVELLHRARVFVFASRQEGFGLVLLEAMASGLPIVARDLPVYHDFFEDGKNGHLVDGDQIDETLADRVNELLTEPEAVAEIRSTNGVTAEQYGWDNTAARTETVLHDVCRTGRSGLN